MPVLGMVTGLSEKDVTQQHPPMMSSDDVDKGGKVHFMDLVAISLHYNEEW